MKKIIKKTLVSFMIFLFSLAPISPQVLWNFSQAEDTISLSGDYENDLVISDRLTVIKKGATLNIKNGADIIFTERNSQLSVEGNLIIEGTKINPSIVKGSSEQGGFAISVKTGADVYIKDAQIIKGGYSLALVNGLANKVLASARTYHGAVDVWGGKTNIEYTTFEDNQSAVIAEHISDPNYSLKVNYSKFIDNDFDVEALNGEDFTNNYWDNFQNDKDVCNATKSVADCLPNSYGNFKINPWQED